ncbi:DUF3597 domain-containing protein [Alterisphingorhabdus coralli]|uniref:DUF3597 domain-containing protein n=1 Tax=Alterisphingorhabdus coralli TaxID=3071408 RepID=A0AA97HZF6_9SPHN|nr:DUF3597 domain-containing protein [Parasphingorhabdus sp. SCSIO 66989]WOE73802.1 DUF3597 domain-containing protein [Parasphingorhabdus sp. SCSIO 66989]
MGIFSSIKNAIWGSEEEKTPEKPQEGAVTAAVAAAAAAAGAAAQSSVDVEAVLDAKPGADALNWRTSIVDLMKLVGLDPSFDNRKELAGEMGRADYGGSAEDNIWLHKKVLQELSANGGKVPADLL